MYLVSESYANKITSDDRTFAIRLTFGSSNVLTGTTIQNITLDEIINSTDVLTMGCACSNKITVNLINPPTDIAYDGATFTAEISLLLNDRPVDYEDIPLGKFYTAIPETSNDFKNLKLTAYDGFCKMTGKYNAKVTSETTLQAVYDDLKTQLLDNCGIVLKARTLPEYTISNFPYLDITYTQAIGYVAGCLGGNARFDREGELEIVWYTDNVTEISRQMQYMNGFKRTTDKTLTVTSIATGTKENPIVRGEGANGTQITFENPYITAEMADDIFENVNNLSYTPCTVKWRGNPAIQAGDVVQVLDKNGIPHNVLVMSQSLKVGGGCNATIDCKGKGETTSQFSNTFESIGQKIERVYKTLEQSILDATNSITGNKGGYVIFNDTNADGKPDEILIMDTEDIATATNVWRWNKLGLGHSSNGYSGPYKTAITADGKINADMILTGALSADYITIGDEKLGKYIRLKDGIMHFGNSDNALSLRLGEIDGTQQVAFYDGDVRKAYFSNNSFEIEHLEDGMFRVENLAIMPRKSGNISFIVLPKQGGE
jgi:hypothetical protein